MKNKNQNEAEVRLPVFRPVRVTRIGSSFEKTLFAEVSNGVVPCFHGLATTPLGLWGGGAFPQGSSFLATLGFEPESRWDSAGEFPKGITL